MSAAKSIRRIAVIQDDAQGGTNQVILFNTKKKKKKRQTLGLAEVERVVRRIYQANNDFGSDYLRRHKRSNRKRRDGWIRDLGNNVFRATRKGSKRLRLRRLVRI
mgnify:CR=1 FL=1